jgi:hypothetical protein
MMKHVERSDDSPTQGPADQPGDPKPGHLAFLRWLAERDQIEHQPFGPPSGRYAPVRGATPLTARHGCSNSGRRQQGAIPSWLLCKR